MFKPKKIIIPAAAAFVITFLISIISIHKFPRSLLRGVIFAVIFGALGFLIDFLNTKFLTTDNGSASGSDDSSDSGKSEDRTRGNMVDLTINDENLTEDEKGPAFAVSMNKVALSESDREDLKRQSEESQETSSPVAAESSYQSESVAERMASENTSAASSSQTSGFTPINLGQPLESFSSGDSGSETKIIQGRSSAPERSSKASSSSPFASEATEIDSLPDFVENSEKVEESDIIDTSEFAQSGLEDVISTSHTSSIDDAASNNHDASTIAKAITTLLKRDDE